MKYSPDVKAGKGNFGLFIQSGYSETKTQGTSNWRAEEPNGLGPKRVSREKEEQRNLARNSHGHTGNVKLSVRINRQLFSGESEFQRIDVFDSDEFGRFLSADGSIVFSEKDEFIYDEMKHMVVTVVEALA